MTPFNFTAAAQAIYTNQFGGKSVPEILLADEQPMCGAKRYSLNATVTIDGTAGSYIAFPVTQKKFRVEGFRVIAQDTATTAYALINKAADGTRTTIASITQTTPTAGDLTEETSFDDVTGTIFNPGQTPEVYIFRSGVTSVPVSILITVVPVGNT